MVPLALRACWNIACMRAFPKSDEEICFSCSIAEEIGISYVDHIFAGLNCGRKYILRSDVYAPQANTQYQQMHYAYSFSSDQLLSVAPAPQCSSCSSSCLLQKRWSCTFYTFGSQGILTEEFQQNTLYIYIYIYTYYICIKVQRYNTYIYI